MNVPRFWLSVDAFLLRLPRLWIAVLALAVVVLIGLVDYCTGYEASLAIFYLGPICAATWYAGIMTGMMTAGFASITWLVADMANGHDYSHPTILVWNTALLLGSFTITAGLLDSLRGRLDLEHRLARTDSVTGVLNRRAFIERLEYLLAVCAREAFPITLVYVDIDCFKSINDTSGHAQGDAVLRDVAHTLLGCARVSDVVARLGGDEFGMVLVGADADAGQAAIAKIREALWDRRYDGTRAVTCSIGGIALVSTPPSADELLSAADEVLYRVKRAGGNAAIVQPYERSASVDLRG